MNECNCSWTEKILGEGCRVCNPQDMIDLLLEHIAELELELFITELKVAKSCEGCKYYHPETYLEHKYCACNNKCSLWNYTDYYEPKEQK